MGGGRWGRPGDVRRRLSLNTRHAASDLNERRRTSTCVRAGGVGHTTRWPVVALRRASSPHSTAGVYKSGIRNRVRVRGFFHEFVRNRPLTRF